MKTILNNKKVFIGVIVGTLVFLGMFLRYDRLMKRELWVDEKYQIHQTKGEFKSIWQRHSYGDNTAFPGDYLLTYYVVNHFDPNKWLMAIPHILSTLLGFYLLYLLAGKFFETFTGYFVAFTIVVFNRELIFHSFELRPYAVLPTLALAVFYVTGWLNGSFKELSMIQKILIGSFYGFVILFHAYGMLIVGVAVLYYFLQHSQKEKSREQTAGILKYFLLVFVVFFPMWVWYALGNPLNVVEPHPDVFLYIPDPLVSPLGFLKSIIGNLLGNKMLYVLLPGLVGALILIPKMRWSFLVFFLTLIALPIMLILLVDVKCSYLFIQRQFVWVVPFFALLLGWVWDGLALFVSQKLQSTRILQSKIRP